ncbi:MAG: methylated-DNA--[protein]-cysteine S-methyltransferase [Mobilicoccus sp.]|nr:methylated-DNA--[protein]-cysteine S-methyltransferase [Mobilicoccus sp.]
MSRSHCTLPSPLGPLTLVADDGALVGVYMAGHRHAPTDHGPVDEEAAPLPEARRQLTEYFAGARQGFDLPVRSPGTEFQQRVWAALERIPYGETWSYARLATEIGNPKAARAVGLANGRNPVSIVVPCHRVVGASGALTGYGGGVENKRILLDLERSL